MVLFIYTYLKKGATMSSVQLLDKTRKINKLLQDTRSQKVVFNDICKVLSETVASNVLVISKKGKVLGTAEYDGIPPIGELIADDVGRFVDKMFNERILNILSTKENVNLETLGFGEGRSNTYKAIVTPVNLAGQRHSTLFMYKLSGQYDIDDIILCEYGATVVGLEMMRAVYDETAEENRKVQGAKAAVGTLTDAELEAVKYIFKELPSGGGLLVASRIAEKTGITRSVIVNALKKLESAGVIESRSSGMKGTNIKVFNESVYDELGL